MSKVENDIGMEYMFSMDERFDVKTPPQMLMRGSYMKSIPLVPERKNDRAKRLCYLDCDAFMQELKLHERMQCSKCNILRWDILDKCFPCISKRASYSRPEPSWMQDTIVWV